MCFIIVTDFFKDESLHIRSVRNPKGYARYLTHKDNLEKAQYDDKEVFTSDKTLYEELVNRSITISNTDNILIQFKDYVLSPNFDFNHQTLCIYEWFEKKGKIDYFLKNEILLKHYVQRIIDFYIERG